MKSIRVHEFGGPEALKLEEVPTPIAGPGQALVRIHAAGVNPVDTYLREGAYGKSQVPYTPGFDAAGVIESVGDGVTAVSAGDRVYTAGTITGAYAELALCSGSQIHRLPDNITFAQGACIGVPYATAYRALFQRAEALPGECVLIHGATGGVGTAAIQLARACGLKVVGTGGTEKGLELIKKEGAHLAIDHRAPDQAERIIECCNGAGADVILEMLANVNLGMDLKVLAKKGRVVVIGSRGPVEVDPRDAMGRDAAVLGMSLFNATERELASIHSALAAGLENGTLRPVVGRELPLKDAAQAHKDIIGQRAFGKIVLIP